MFNNTAIDVTIGLIFIFLLYSLLATILQEIFANWLGTRRRFLVKIIRRMLESHEYGQNAIKDYFEDVAESIKYYFNPFPDKRSFAHAFYCHPIIKQLGEGRLNTKPSYIGSDLFAQTIIDLLRGEVYDNTANQMQEIRKTIWAQAGNDFTISNDTAKTLKAIWTDSHEDITKFKANLETWYNRMQERGTGWYKRTVQFMLFLIGMGCAAGFNVDAIAIARILTKDKNARESMVKMAESRYKDYGKVLDTISKKREDTVYTVVIAQRDTVAENMYRRLKNDAEETQEILGLGWKKSDTDKVKLDSAIATLHRTFDTLREKGHKKHSKYIAALHKASADIDESIKGSRWRNKYQNYWWCGIPGWIITALAISLGAPFWFDLLNKIMVLRGTGKKPPTNTEEKNTETIASPKRVG